MDLLVTLTQARRHLRLDSGVSSPLSDEDLDIQLKLEIAQALVLDYVKQRRLDGDAWAAEVDSWAIEGSPVVLPPKQVIGAILVQLAELYRFRGDDGPKDAPVREHGYLSPVVTALLYRLRDPAIA